MFLHSLDKYSRYVSIMKVILPVGIFLILICSLGWPYIVSLNTPVEVESDEQPEHDRMIHPRYMSTNEKGQPYEVTASIAEQGGKAEVTHLTNPKGSLQTDDGNTVSVEAATGVYNQEDKELILKGRVTLTSTDGYNVQTEQAHVTLDSRVIQSDKPVTGVGPKGTLQGQKGFQIERQEQGDIITLKGRSHIVINQGQ